MTFGEKIKNERVKRDMSLQEFADLLGTSKAVLSRYEHDQFSPKITKVAEWAQKLNVSLDYFVEDSITDPNGVYVPSSVNPTKEEAMLLGLFRAVPNDQKEMVINMIKVALKK